MREEVPTDQNIFQILEAGQLVTVAGARGLVEQVGPGPVAGSVRIRFADGGMVLVRVGAEVVIH